MVEKLVRFETIIEYFAQPRILKQYCYLLSLYRENDHFVNHMIVKFLYQVLTQCELPLMMCNISFFRVYSTILEDPYLEASAVNDAELKTNRQLYFLARTMVRTFVESAPQDPFMFVDALFWNNKIHCHVASFRFVERQNEELSDRYASRKWTQEDDDLLRNIYDSTPSRSEWEKQIQEYFPHRTMTAITGRGRKLGLKAPKKMKTKTNKNKKNKKKNSKSQHRSKRRRIESRYTRVTFGQARGALEEILNRIETSFSSSSKNDKNETMKQSEELDRCRQALKWLSDELYMFLLNWQDLDAMLLVPSTSEEHSFFDPTRCALFVSMLHRMGWKPNADQGETFFKIPATYSERQVRALKKILLQWRKRQGDEMEAEVMEEESDRDVDVEEDPSLQASPPLPELPLQDYQEENETDNNNSSNNNNISDEEEYSSDEDENEYEESSPDNKENDALVPHVDQEEEVVFESDRRSNQVEESESSDEEYLFEDDIQENNNTDNNTNNNNNGIDDNDNDNDNNDNDHNIDNDDDDQDSISSTEKSNHKHNRRLMKHNNAQDSSLMNSSVDNNGDNDKDHDDQHDTLFDQESPNLGSAVRLRRLIIDDDEDDEEDQDDDNDSNDDSNEENTENNGNNSDQKSTNSDFNQNDIKTQRPNRDCYDSNNDHHYHHHHQKSESLSKDNKVNTQEDNNEEKLRILRRVISNVEEEIPLNELRAEINVVAQRNDLHKFTRQQLNTMLKEMEKQNLVMIHEDTVIKI